MTRKTCSFVFALLMLITAVSAAYGQAPPTVTIGGEVYSGTGTVYYTLDPLGEPIIHRNPVYKPAAPPIAVGAKVVLQDMGSGLFVANGTFTPGTNVWTAEVAPGGVYLAMYGAPDHELTSRVFDLSNLVWITGAPGYWQNATSGLPPLTVIDAYLPALHLNLDTGVIDPALPAEPLANLLVYAFYENAVNGSPDFPTDPGLELVHFELLDLNGDLVSCGTPPGPCEGMSINGTGNPSAITTKDGLVFGGDAATGLYYFTDIVPGKYLLRATPPSTFEGNPIEWYHTYTMEGGQEWVIILAPGDPGTEAGAYLAWFGFAEKTGQVPFPGQNSSTITGWVEDADVGFEAPVAGEPPEPCCPLIPLINPGVTTNGAIPDAVVILWQRIGDTFRLVATTEAINAGPGIPPEDVGMFQFVNVPPGTYTLFIFDKPLNYVFGEIQLDVNPGSNIVFPRVANEMEGLPLPIVARFMARIHGAVCTADWQISPLITDRNHPDYGCPLGTGVAGATVYVRAEAGNAIRETTTDANGQYLFDTMGEIEVMAFVTVEPPPGYRGATVTDVYYPNAFINPDPWCDPATDPFGCIPDPGLAVSVDRNGAGRYVKWFTSNYLLNLKLEPIPATTGEIAGRVFIDTLARGTWAGDGIYDPINEASFQGATIELWDATGTSPILDPLTLQPVITTSGVYSEADIVVNQGYIPGGTIPPDEWGGMFSGPILGYYEFNNVPTGVYTVKLRLPASPVIPEAAEFFDDFGTDGLPGTFDLDGTEGNGVYDLGEPYIDANGNGRWDPVNALNGYTAASLSSLQVVVAGGARNDVNFGINTLAPSPGFLEGAIFDDVFLDNRACSALNAEKAPLVGLPVVVRDHLGYVLDVMFQPSPVCYPGTTPALDPNNISCLDFPAICDRPDLGTGVEIARYVAPGPRYYVGNDPVCCSPPVFPGDPQCAAVTDPILAQCVGTFDPGRMSLELPYTMGQGTAVYEADWSLPFALPDPFNPQPGNMCVTGLLAVETPAETWGVQVTVTVEDLLGPTPGAEVFARFIPGESAKCITNGAGQCNLVLEKVDDPTIAGVTLMIDTVMAGEGQQLTYGFDPLNPGNCVNNVTVWHGAPTAAFGITPTQPVMGQTITFNAGASQGNIVNYAWNFADLNNGAGVIAQHAYGFPGIYHATLTVTAANGVTDMVGMDITVVDPSIPVPPVALFTATPNPQDVGLAVSFDATASSGFAPNMIVSYEWDWESDGIVDLVSPNATASHTYTVAGSYNVTLKVTDNQFPALTDTATSPVLIEDPGAPNATRVIALDGTGTISEGTKWFATVNLTVANINGPLAGAKVVYTFAPGEQKAKTTNGNGQLFIKSETVENPNIDAIDFTINDVQVGNYDAAGSLTNVLINRP